jgi:hypothetical protein
MIKAIQLIFFPFKTWERIAEAGHSIFYILLAAVAPMLAIGLGLERAALIRWGDRMGEFGHVTHISPELATKYSAAQCLLILFGIFVISIVVQLVAQSFQMRVTYKQCFTLVAYGYTGIILSRVIDALPFLPTWVCWALGTLLSLSLLYHGVGLVLKPEQTKGFGMYLITMILFILFGGLSHFIALSVLDGRIAGG